MQVLNRKNEIFLFYHHPRSYIYSLSLSIIYHKIHIDASVKLKKIKKLNKKVNAC